MEKVRYQVNANVAHWLVSWRALHSVGLNPSCYTIKCSERYVESLSQTNLSKAPTKDGLSGAYMWKYANVERNLAGRVFIISACVRHRAVVE